jgi:plastocyanin
MRRSHLAYRFTVVAVATAALTWAACSDSTTGTDNGNGNGNGVPTNISPVSGNNQRIIVSGTLLEPLVVRVLDDGGDGVRGVTVMWSVTAGGGSVSSATSVTNVAGDASISFTAGTTEESNTINASVDGITSSINLTAVAVAPNSVSVSGGGAQTARTSQSLADELEVTVEASDNGPVPGATVDWMVTGGGGNLSSASSTTDADGAATNGLTLGPNVGDNTVQASAGAGINTNVTAAGTQAVTVTVTMQNIAFNAPGGGDDITIMLGDTVSWTNADAVLHTATSNSTPSGGLSFDSGNLVQGAGFSFVPNTRGEWVYFCEIHPTQMQNARITVE